MNSDSVRSCLAAAPPAAARAHACMVRVSQGAGTRGGPHAHGRERRARWRRRVHGRHGVRPRQADLIVRSHSYVCEIHCFKPTHTPIRASLTSSETSDTAEAAIEVFNGFGEEPATMTESSFMMPDMDPSTLPSDAFSHPGGRRCLVLWLSWQYSLLYVPWCLCLMPFVFVFRFHVSL